ncbi:MAG: JAB domain-containing protein [Myxococcales bacterium]|nr:JAB domain-containing protein [Myxococcales bacterium]
MPPESIAPKVEALRELLRTGGCAEPLTGRILSSRDVASYFVPKLGADSLESIWIVGLDAKGRARVVRQVARGGPAHCMVAPGDLLRVLVLNACPSGIVVHNHPSGDPTPSPEDVDLTRRARTGAELLGLRLLDHVIVGGARHFSFVDEGLLEPELRRSA